MQSFQEPAWSNRKRGVAKGYVPKITVPVELLLHNGTTVRGSVFLPATVRVLDLLGDERQFIPFADGNGRISLMNKSFIVKVTPFDTSGN